MICIWIALSSSVILYNKYILVRRAMPRVVALTLIAWFTSRT